jgi:hypothetical protein
MFELLQTLLSMFYSTSAIVRSRTIEAYPYNAE